MSPFCPINDVIYISTEIISIFVFQVVPLTKQDVLRASWCSGNSLHYIPRPQWHKNLLLLFRILEQNLLSGSAFDCVLFLLLHLCLVSLASLFLSDSVVFNHRHNIGTEDKGSSKKENKGKERKKQRNNTNKKYLLRQRNDKRI